MNKTQLEINHGLVMAQTYKIMMEIMVSDGESLSSPQIVELKRRFEKHIYSSVKLRESLNNQNDVATASINKCNFFIKSV